MLQVLFMITFTKKQLYIHVLALSLNQKVLELKTLAFIVHICSDFFFSDVNSGGLRRASALISGTNVYKHLKFEAGVHRVQRVPKTERSGRVHTSTMTVAVLPQPSQVGSMDGWLLNG